MDSVNLSHKFGRPIPVTQCSNGQEVRELAARVTAAKRMGFHQSVWERRCDELAARVLELTSALDFARTERDKFKDELDGIKIEFGLNKLDVAATIPRILEIQNV